MKDAFGLSAIYWIVHRELKLTMRRKSEAITPLLFFVIVTSLFPLSVGTDVEMLRRIAPGVLWVTALLATMLSLPRLFEQDYADGTLEQLVLSPAPLSAMVVGKVVAYWLMTGLPLALLAPLLALQFHLPSTSILILATTLLLGTPVLALIGSIGASLTLGLRGGGVLVALLVLPLYVPVLIFGTGAVDAAAAGLGATANISLLTAMLLVAGFFSPMATTAALRIALE